jgi:acyl carrier protein
MTETNMDQLKQNIRTKLGEIAAALGNEVGELGDDDLILASGAIDSAGIMELINWFEDEIGVRIASSEFTIDNLGTLNQMAAFAQKKTAKA